jgi:GTP-binding protein
MVVGENPRAEDLDINITKEKKLTNIRSSTAEELERLARPRILSLEEALEFCAPDECVEVTPKAVRLRKVVLDVSQRAKQRSRERQRDRNA